MPEYTDPATVEPGRAGTATVRGVKGVRLIKQDRVYWTSATPHPERYQFHKDEHISDLVLDPLPGEAPADSITITLEELVTAAPAAATPGALRGYADKVSALRKEGAARLLRLIADKLAALPKPVPPEPEGDYIVTDRHGAPWIKTPDGKLMSPGIGTSLWHAIAVNEHKVYRAEGAGNGE